MNGDTHYSGRRPVVNPYHRDKKTPDSVVSDTKNRHQTEAGSFPRQSKMTNRTDDGKKLVDESDRSFQNNADMNTTKTLMAHNTVHRKLGSSSSDKNNGRCISSGASIAIGTSVVKNPYKSKSQKPRNVANRVHSRSIRNPYEKKSTRPDAQHTKMISEASLKVKSKNNAEKCAKQTCKEPSAEGSSIPISYTTQSHKQETQKINQGQPPFERPINHSSPIKRNRIKTKEVKAKDKFIQSPIAQKSSPISASPSINPYTRKPMMPPVKPIHGSTILVGKESDISHNHKGNTSPISDVIIRKEKSDNDYTRKAAFNSLPVDKVAENPKEMKTSSKPIVVEHTSQGRRAGVAKVLNPSSLSTLPISKHRHDVNNPYKRQCLEPNHGSTTLESIKPTFHAQNNEGNQSITNAAVLKPASNMANMCKPLVTKSPSFQCPKLPQELEYDRSRLKHVDDEHRLKLIKAADLGGTLKNGWKLLPHQKVGVLKSIQMRRYLLAYDMGLGKTLIGCVWAKAFKSTFEDLKVYVIAPVSLKKEWARTATDVVGLKCEEDKSKKNSLDEDSLDVRISSWAKVPLRVPPKVKHFVVICDEAHNMQSMESCRTQDTLKLLHSDRCIGVLLLTGTPMKNGKPSNLFPLLRAVRHPFGDDQKIYEMFFCNGQLKRFRNKEVWDASGSSNLVVLNAHIISHVLYKTKEDCLKELPGKKREYKRVPVCSKFAVQHSRALNDLAKIYQTMNSQSDGNNGNDAILGAFARLRQVAAFAKIDATVALVKSLLQEESSIVIFTYFVAVAKEVHRKLENLGWNGEILAGETPSAKRQAMVDNFQDGISPVFIATFGAGGVGITLTAARTIILMDRPWTPGDALQAEDRVRRIGQTKNVRSIWMTAFDIDEQIDNLIEHKSQNASTVVNSNRNSTSNDFSNISKAAPKISIRQLVQCIVANKKENET